METYFSAYLAKTLQKSANYKNIGSTRQCQVAALIGSDCTNKEIAVMLTISDKTVEKHRASLKKRFGLRTTSSITKWALANDLIQNEFLPVEKNK